MIKLPLSTADTTLAAGRARCLAWLNARAQSIGLAAFFPADQVIPGRAPAVPISALSHLLTAQQRTALAGDFVVIDVSDGLISRPPPTPDAAPVVTGYFMDLLVALRRNDSFTPQLAGILSGPFRQAAVSERNRTAEELALDPAAPTKVQWRENGGVRFHGLNPPRVPKHAFLGEA